MKTKFYTNNKKLKILDILESFGKPSIQVEAEKSKRIHLSLKLSLKDVILPEHLQKRVAS